MLNWFNALPHNKEPCKHTCLVKENAAETIIEYYRYQIVMKHYHIINIRPRRGEVVVGYKSFKIIYVINDGAAVLILTNNEIGNNPVSFNGPEYRPGNQNRYELLGWSKKKPIRVCIVDQGFVPWVMILHKLLFFPTKVFQPNKLCWFNRHALRVMPFHTWRKLTAVVSNFHQVQVNNSFSQLLRRRMRSCMCGHYSHNCNCVAVITTVEDIILIKSNRKYGIEVGFNCVWCTGLSRCLRYACSVRWCRKPLEMAILTGRWRLVWGVKHRHG